MQSLNEIINQINDAVKVAANTPQNPEKKLRELISPIWGTFLKEKRVGLNLQIRDELTLANGRADTVFNRLILEYKKPYAIKPDNNKNRQLITQVQGYILDFAKKERFSKERLLGVAFDGDHFLFMRYVGRWIVDEPLPVNESSLEIFLKILEKLTSKAALIPENLIRDFAVGPESRNKVAVDCIKAFYHEINQHGNSGDTKEHVFFEQWTVQFAEVHGSLEQKKIDKEVLFTSYGFSKKEQENFNVLAFFFALDSYYAVLMKLLSYQVVVYYTLSKLTGLPLQDWETLDSDDLKKRCNELEEGGIFRSIGIRNFLEGDLFSWYIQAWNDGIYRAIQQIVKYLNDYDPETMEIAPDETRDILKKLYQYLVPKQIRHDLGEYYTPDWLAERTLNQVGYGAKDKDLFNKRLLDPGCGSGTFVILGIKRAKEHATLYGIDPAVTLQYITMNIMGFDLNPLAVISARTNYIMAIADLLKFKKGEITIPIYLCDSINPPQARVAHEKTLFAEKTPYEVKTSVGNFYFSHSIISKKRIQHLANLMEDGVKAGQPTKDFVKKVGKELQLTIEEVQESEAHLIETFERLLELEKKGINGIWARIIKNAFAPLFVGQFDLIVGNPPWVNWEALPEGYRNDTEHLWSRYQLLVGDDKSARQISSKSKTDISILMTYVALNNYLVPNGKLSFVITQTIIKTERGGRGFRRFQLPASTPFKLIHFDDFSSFQPFEDATNRTSVILIMKGEKQSYPVPYSYWKKKLGKINSDYTLSEVVAMTERKHWIAEPINKSDLLSPWISGKKKALDAISVIKGQSKYNTTCREGSNTRGANGIFWVERLTATKNGLVSINNLPDLGRTNIASINMDVEDQFLFPLIRGKDVNRWHVDNAYYILNVQDPERPSSPYPLSMLQSHFPKTYEYLTKFEDQLRRRKIFRNFDPTQKEFYGLYNIGKYSYSPYKVLWREQSSFLTAAVAGTNGGKPAIPDHKLMMLPCETMGEAYYLCACVNSKPTAFIVKSYSIDISISTHILKYINIPFYDRANHIHRELSRISEECHKKVAADINISDLEDHIDELIIDLWGLSKEEFKDIKDCLEELR